MMQPSLTFTRLAIAFGATLGILAASAPPVLANHAGPNTNEDEIRCEQRSAFNVGTYGRRYAKCLLKCAHKAPSRAAAASDCTMAGACGLDPFGRQCQCLTRAVDGAVAGQAGACVDCPECYVNSNPGGANPECGSDASDKMDDFTAWIESLYFGGTTPLYCEDGNGLTPNEIGCQQTTAKALAYLSRTYAFCYRDCRQAEHEGQATLGSCDPPALSNPNADATLKNCILHEHAKLERKMKARCDASEGKTPECWGSLGPLDWAAQVEQFSDGQDGLFYCVDPEP